MDIRAWGVGALVFFGGIGSPFGGEESNAARAPIPVTRAAFAAQVDQAVLVVADQWTDEQGDMMVGQFGPAAFESAPHPRNPAGQLVLPAPQTSRAPAF